MHQLTITATDATVVTRHDDFGEARSALLGHARSTDTYVRSLTASESSGLATFQLIGFDDTGRIPRVTATVTIEPSPPPS